MSYISKGVNHGMSRSLIVNFLIVYTMAGLKKICSIYTIAVKILVGISLRISFVL